MGKKIGALLGKRIKKKEKTKASPDAMGEEKKASQDAPSNGSEKLAAMAPLVFGALALAFGLCGQVLPLVGAALGAAALVMQRTSIVNVKKQKAPRATMALAIVGIVFSAALSFYQPQPSAISLTVDAPDWQASYGKITVQVAGETTQGETFTDELNLEPNEPYEIADYQPGTYTFSVDEDNLEQGDELFEPDGSDFECQLGLGQTAEVIIPLELVPQDGKLSLSLSSTIVPADATSATITVSGTTDEGQPFTDSFEMAFGETRDLSDYPKGDYTFSIEPSSFTIDDTVYAIAPRQTTLTKREDISIALAALVDDQATQELAEQRAAEQAAAEEAARAAAEAEAQRQQEEAARAAEAQRQQEAASQPTEQTVYITDTGSKYHRSGCRYLRQSSHAISLSSAQSQGYEPCKVCKPPQ